MTTRDGQTSSTAAAYRALVFHADAAISELTATLNWNFTSKTSHRPWSYRIPRST